MKRNYLKLSLGILGLVIVFGGLAFLFIHGKSTQGKKLINGVPQIPMEECDSMLAYSMDDHYGFIYKDGKCGIYDMTKNENVTEIEYPPLYFSCRKEVENGGWYSYFYWEDDTLAGTIGVAEANNTFIVVTAPKKSEC